MSDELTDLAHLMSRALDMVDTALDLAEGPFDRPRQVVVVHTTERRDRTRWNELGALVDALNEVSFDDNRLDILRESPRCLDPFTVGDVASILETFTFDTTKVDACRFLRVRQDRRPSETAYRDLCDVFTFSTHRRSALRLLGLTPRRYR